MKEELEKLISEAFQAFKKEEDIPDLKMPKIELEYTKEEKFGDYSSNFAMSLGSAAKKNPKEIADKLKNKISHKNLGRIEVAGPGYLNFYLSDEFLRSVVLDINEKKDSFGKNDIGIGKSVQIEFISSNPTGPIHLGNGRGGPLGDTLGNIFQKSGYRVEREFYINDYGKQIEALGNSVLGNKEAQYSGDYIGDLRNKVDDKMKDPKEVGTWASQEILENLIKPTVKNMGIKFDSWFSEKSLQEKNSVVEVIEELKKKGLTYEKEGALWFSSTKFGDDKDRVLVKADGENTYVATDFAYHKNKIERKFDKLINIQGADHHKEAAVVKAFVENVLEEKEKLDSILVQFVRIVENGKELKMSKRKGVYFAMDDLIEEVGKDAVRFIFLSYSPTSHINFNIDIAKEKSEKNPVYYVQYAHARICSILRKAEELNQDGESVDFSKLIHEKERDLMKELNRFPYLIRDIAETYEVHRLPHYSIRLADKFHSFYGACKVIDDSDKETSKARLKLSNAVRITLQEALRIMGVNAPEKM